MGPMLRRGFCLAPAGRDDAVLLLNPALGDRLLVGSTDQLLEAFTPPEEPALQPARWLEVSEEEHQRGLRLRICHSKVCDGTGRATREDLVRQSASTALL